MEPPISSDSPQVAPVKWSPAQKPEELKFIKDSPRSKSQPEMPMHAVEVPKVIAIPAEVMRPRRDAGARAHKRLLSHGESMLESSSESSEGHSPTSDSGKSPRHPHQHAHHSHHSHHSHNPPHSSPHKRHSASFELNDIVVTSVSDDDVPTTARDPLFGGQRAILPTDPHNPSAFPHPVMFQHIMGFLELPDVLSAIRVCRLWHNFAQGRDFWLTLYESYVLRIKDPRETDIFIWSADRPEEDKRVSEDKDGNIRFATLNSLVERLTPPDAIPDKSDAETLLNTYNTFTTTQQLVRKLFERYNVPTPPNVDDFDKWSKESKRPIQVRTCFILKALIQKSWPTFDVCLKRLVRVMIRLLDKNLSLVIKTQILKEEAKNRTKSTLELLTPSSNVHGFSLQLPLSAPSSTQSSPQTPHTPGPMTARRFGSSIFGMLQRRTLDSLKSIDIARQLTLLDFAIYVKIQPQELVNQSWSKKNKDVNSPNVRCMIDRFNYMTRAIATSILNEEKLKARVKMMTKWIKVADHLRQLNNFHTFMAVLMGLEEGSIYRLKFTKEEIDPKFSKLLEEMQEVMSKESSYANYRKALAAATPPCLPYLGIYLRDLVYIETGTVAEQEVQDQKNIIQFRQKKKVFGVIHFLQSYQTTPYPFGAHEDVIEFLENLPALSEEEMFELSNKREPKGAKRSSLM